MDDPSNVQPVSDEESPQQEPAGDFVVHAERTEKSLLSASQELTPLQQSKKDALALAELIYGIYKENESNVNIGANAISGKDEQNA
jgi:hypothetical protein